MNVLFFSVLFLYFAASVLQFAGTIFKKPKLQKAAAAVFAAGFAAHTVFLLRGALRPAGCRWPISLNSRVHSLGQSV